MNSRECAHIDDKSRSLDAGEKLYVAVPMTEFFKFFEMNSCLGCSRTGDWKKRTVISVARAVETFGSNEDQSRRSIRSIRKSVPQLFCVYRWCLIGRFPIKKRVKFSVIWLKRMKGEWIFIYSSNFWKERSFLLSS